MPKDVAALEGSHREFVGAVSQVNAVTKAVTRRVLPEKPNSGLPFQGFFEQARVTYGGDDVWRAVCAAVQQ